MTRVVTKLAIELARFTDVVEYEYAACHAALAVANWRGGTLNIELVAIATNQQRRPDRLDRTITSYGYRQRIFERLTRFLMKAAKYFIDRPSARIIDFPTRQLFGNRVNVLDIAIRICRDDTIAD